MQATTKYELAINIKTVKELGCTAPPSLLARSDEVIESGCVHAPLLLILTAFLDLFADLGEARTLRGGNGGALLEASEILSDTG